MSKRKLTSVSSWKVMRNQCILQSAMKFIALGEKPWSMHSAILEPAGLKLNFNILPINCSFRSAMTAVELTLTCWMPGAKGIGDCQACASEQRETAQNLKF